MCFGALRCVKMCFGVLRCVKMCFGALRCVKMSFDVLPYVLMCYDMFYCVKIKKPTRTGTALDQLNFFDKSSCS